MPPPHTHHPAALPLLTRELWHLALGAGTATENKRGVVDAVYESRALLADHKAPADETMKSNLGM